MKLSKATRSLSQLECHQILLERKLYWFHCLWIRSFYSIIFTVYLTGTLGRIETTLLISSVLTDQVQMMMTTMMMMETTTIIIVYIDLIFLVTWISCTAFWDKSCKLPTVHNKDIISGHSGTVGFCAGLWCLESWTHILALISSENKFGGSCLSLCSPQFKCSHSSVQLAFSM